MDLYTDSRSVSVTERDVYWKSTNPSSCYFSYFIWCKRHAFTRLGIQIFNKNTLFVKCVTHLTGIDKGYLECGYFWLLGDVKQVVWADLGSNETYPFFSISRAKLNARILLNERACSYSHSHQSLTHNFRCQFDLLPKIFYTIEWALSFFFLYISFIVSFGLKIFRTSVTSNLLA